MKRFTPLSLLTVALLGIATPIDAARPEPLEQEAGKPPAEERRDEPADAAEAIKHYAADKREEAAKKAKAALEALDARIDALDKRLDKDWDRMDKAARERARNTMRALHEQRVQVAEWYGRLQYSTAKAWEHTKKGFSDAYKSLRGSWERAEREYPSEDGKKNQK